MVESKLVELVVAGSNPVGHPSLRLNAVKSEAAAPKRSEGGPGFTSAKSYGSASRVIAAEMDVVSNEIHLRLYPAK